MYRLKRKIFWCYLRFRTPSGHVLTVCLSSLSAEDIELPSVSGHVTTRTAIYQWSFELFDITPTGCYHTKG